MAGGLFSRLASVFKATDPRRTEAQLSLASILQSSNRPPPDSLAIGQVDATNPTIYALITRLTEDITSVPLQLVTVEGTDEFEVIEEHEALIPIRQPNELETTRTFFQQIAADIIWMGDGFVWTDGDPNKGILPQNFIRLLPSQMTAVPPKVPNGKMIDHYTWRTQDGQQRPIAPEVLLHFRTRNPEGPYRGMGVGVRLRDWLNLETQAMQWQYRRFYNDIPVDLILKTTSMPKDPATRQRMMEFLDNRLTGRKNGGRRYAILEDGTWDVTALPRANEKEIQYMETLTFIRKTYAMAFGVPPSKLADYADSFRSNSEQQSRDYWSDQIMTWHALILDVLNDKYLKRFWPNEAKLKFQYDYTKVRALQASEADMTTVARQKSDGGIITLNEARESLGQDKSTDPAADELRFNGKTLTSLDAPPPVPVIGDPNASADPNADPAKKPPAKKPPAAPAKAAVIPIASKTFNEDETPASIRDLRQLFDGPMERERLKQIIRRDIEGIVRESGNHQLDLAGLAAAFNTQAPEIIAFVNKQTINLAEPFNDTTEDLIRRVIAESIAEGTPVREMRSKLQDAYEERRADWQLDRVARTEVHQAQEGGGWLAASQNGLDAKRWITARDSRVRGLSPHDQADHAGLEGAVVPMSAPFIDPVSQARLQFPGDRQGAKSGADTINCRCTWVADFSHLKSLDVTVNLESAWETKSANRGRWELGMKRRMRQYLQAQEERVLEKFDAATRAAHAQRTGAHAGV